MINIKKDSKFWSHKQIIVSRRWEERKKTANTTQYWQQNKWKEFQSDEVKIQMLRQEELKEKLREEDSPIMKKQKLEEKNR